MRCHEARDRINGECDQDLDLLEHLSTCADCARFAGAERKLVESLHLVKTAATEPPTQLSVLRLRVETKAAEIERKEVRIMSSLVNHIKVHPRLGVGLALATILFLFVTLVPFSYERIAGYSVAVTVPESGSNIKPQDVEKALALLGHDRSAIKIMKSDAGTTYEIGDFPTRAAAREAGSAIKTLSGQVGSFAVSPVFETVSGSLYAQVRDQIITIQIDGVGKSDAQLESEIAAKLAENGFAGANVSVSTTPDGMRKIDISRESATTSDSAQIKVNMAMAPGNQTVNLNLIGDSTMTDAELKAALEAKLAAEGIQNPVVTITTGPDGKRKVTVEARKD